MFAGQWWQDHSKPLGMNAMLHALKEVYPGDDDARMLGLPSEMGSVMKLALSVTLRKWCWRTK